MIYIIFEGGFGKMLKKLNFLIFLCVIFIILGMFSVQSAVGIFDLEDLEDVNRGEFKFRIETYSDTSDIVMTASMSFEDTSKNVDIKGKQKEVNVINLEGKLISVDYNMSYIQYIPDSGFIDGVIYYSIDDDISKTEYNMFFSIYNTNNDLNASVETDFVLYDINLSDDEPDDLFTGCNWTEVKHSEKKTVSTTFIEDSQQGKPETEWKNETITRHCKCINETNISIPAGFFEVFVVKKITEGEEGYSLDYVDKNSSIVVKSVDIDKYGTINSETVLTSYSFYKDEKEEIPKDHGKDSDDGIPGFEIILLCLASLFFVFLRHKNSL